MKYLRQFFIILGFSFAGEVLHALIPLQVPASIYGLVLLFIALMAGWIKLPQIRLWTIRFFAETWPMDSLEVITGFTMNFTPSIMVMNTEKLPMVLLGSRLEM